MISSPSHVAVLVPSVRKAANSLEQMGFTIGEEEIFNETREIYIHGNEKNPLLLMEPNGPGSYEKALKKRGPGIHHLAIDVLQLEEYLGSLAGSGWLLHLNSVKTIKSIRTAYLARPGFPALIEVHEKKELMSGPLFVEELSLNFDPAQSGLLKALGLGEIVKPGEPSFEIKGMKIDLEDLL